MTFDCPSCRGRGVRLIVCAGVPLTLTCPTCVRGRVQMRKVEGINHIVRADADRRLVNHLVTAQVYGATVGRAPVAE